MCWIGPEIPYRAEEDIDVFKIVKVVKFADKTIIKAYFREFVYEIGKTYNSDLEIINMFDGNSRITIGLHSYDKRCKRYTSSFGIKVMQPFRGSIYYDPTDPYKAAVLHCIIPKGSTYYVNCRGEYVSNYLHTIKLEIKDFHSFIRIK